MKHNNPFIRFANFSLIAWLVSCTVTTPTPNPLTLTERAAAEATAIVQRAEATAMVLKAQATASAMLQSANEAKQTPTIVSPTKISSAPVVPAVPPQVSAALPAPTPAPEVTSDADRNSQIEIVGVGFAADGGLIIVQFKAPPDVARRWNQTNVYVVDEATGNKYDDVPITPLIGPLFGRPKLEGQLGYVMFYNTNLGIRPGSVVTVVLGEYKQEHLIVQQ